MTRYEDGMEWAYWMTTSPDAGTSRTWASDGTNEPKWTIVLSSGHEIHSDWLPRWRDGWADVEDAEGRKWRLRADAVVGWYHRRHHGGIPPLSGDGKKRRRGMQGVYPLSPGVCMVDNILRKIRRNFRMAEAKSPFFGHGLS